MVVAMLQQSPTSAIANYKNLTTNEKLVFLWYAYLKVKPFLPSTVVKAEAGEIAEELFKQMKRTSFSEQEEVERNIIEGKDGLICNIYSSFSKNTKLYFWYLLGKGMEAGTIAPLPEKCELTPGVIDLLYQMDLMDLEQQIALLKDVFALAGKQM